MDNACSIVDLTVESSASHELNGTNWLKGNSHCKLTKRKFKTKQAKICIITYP